MKYIYGMRLRGFSIGCQPCYGLLSVLSEDEKDSIENSDKYHDLISYDRKLTDEELENYELDFIKEAEN